MGSRTQLTSMRLDDGSADGKPQTHAIRFGTEERFEQVLHIFHRQARAAVPDHDFHLAIRTEGRPHFHPALHGGDSNDCLDGVVHQIDHDLLDLNRVHQHRRKAFGEFERQADSLMPRLDDRKLGSLQHEWVDGTRPAPRPALAHETTQLADDLAGLTRV